MSGLNKHHNQFIKLTYILLFSYILCFIVAGSVLLLYPKINNIKMEKQVNDSKLVIQKALDHTESTIDLKSLNELTKAYPSQLVIKQDNKIIYSNMPISDGDLLREISNDKFVFHKENYTLKTYDVWFLVYQHSSDSILNEVLIIVLALFTIIMLIVFISVKHSFKSLYVTLDDVYNNIQKIKKYKFNDNVDFDDKISIFSNELREFVGDIQDQVEEYMIVYTELEKELLIKNETSSHKKKIVSSLVHDLKTPISIINLSTLSLKKELENNHIDNIESSADDILVDVKSILKVVNEEDIKSEVTKIDLVYELKQSYKTYNKLLKIKKINIIFEMDQTAYIYAHKIEIQSIINNIYSNIHNYSKNATSAYISVSLNNNKYTILVKNEANDIENIDFNNYPNFLRINKENNTSTGFGLYLIDNFAKKNNGVYHFYAQDDYVVNKLEFEKAGIEI